MDLFLAVGHDQARWVYRALTRLVSLSIIIHADRGVILLVTVLLYTFVVSVRGSHIEKPAELFHFLSFILKYNSSKIYQPFIGPNFSLLSF